MIKSGTPAFAGTYFEIGRVADVFAESGARAALGRGLLTTTTTEADAHEEMQTSLKFAKAYDGAADGRISTIFTPNSLTTVGEAFYRDYISEAHEAGLTIHHRAIETVDGVNLVPDDRGQRPLAYAQDLGLLGENDFFADCVQIDETEIEL